MRAFTRFARVDYANGEEVPAERFLTEVETVVLETILARLSKEVGGKGGQYSLASLDTTSRFYENLVDDSLSSHFFANGCVILDVDGERNRRRTYYGMRAHQ